MSKSMCGFWDDDDCIVGSVVTWDDSDDDFAVGGVGSWDNVFGIGGSWDDDFIVGSIGTWDNVFGVGRLDGNGGSGGIELDII